MIQYVSAAVFIYLTANLPYASSNACLKVQIIPKVII